MMLKVPFQVKQLLNNRNVLYGVFAVALLQVLYLLYINRFDLLIVFGLIAFVTYKFNKNMILVLGIPFLIVLLSTTILKEGFEDSATKADKKKDEETKKEDTHIITSHNEEEPSDSADSATEDTPEPHNEVETKEATENNVDPEFDKNQINYASTLTKNMQSYNELLGSDGFAKMSHDTQVLLQQQEQLGNAMKQFAPLIGQMTPFLEKASGLLNNMDMKQINKVANVFKDQ